MPDTNGDQRFIIVPNETLQGIVEFKAPSDLYMQNQGIDIDLCQKLLQALVYQWGKTLDDLGIEVVATEVRRVRRDI